MERPPCPLARLTESVISSLVSGDDQGDTDLLALFQFYQRTGPKPKTRFSDAYIFGGLDG